MAEQHVRTEPEGGAALRVQAGVRGRQVLRRREAQGLGQRGDPVGLALEFDEHADRGLVDRDDAGRVTELFPIFLVAEGDAIAEGLEDGLRSSRRHRCWSRFRAAPS